MAITLSNSGITSGSIVRSAEISQSIDAFTGIVAYDIHQSGSFNTTGSTVLSGSVFLPDNTHMGIGTTPSPTAGVKLALKANDSNNDPTILLEAFGAADSATIGWKNPDVRWNLGLDGGSADSFILKNDVTNKVPIVVDYSSSNSSLVFRNDLGTDIAQRVGINWPYGNLDPSTTLHHLNISGSATASAGFYGNLIGTASAATKVKVSNAISGVQMPFLMNANSTPGIVDLMFSGTDIFINNGSEKYIQTTTISSSNAIGLHGTASWALNATNAGAGLWYDGTTYISSSNNVSASRFEGTTFVGDNFSGSNHTATKFSGSEVDLSNDAGTSAAKLTTSILSFNQNSDAKIFNESTANNSQLRLGLGNPATVGNVHLLISGSNTKSIQVPHGPIYFSNGTNQAAGDVFKVVGTPPTVSGGSFFTFDEFIGDVDVNANGNNQTIWFYNLNNSQGPLPANLPGGVLKFTFDLSLTNRNVNAGDTSDQAATYHIERSYRINSTNQMSNMANGSSGQEIINDSKTAGLPNLSSSFFQPSNQTIFLKFTEGDGENLLCRGTVKYQYSKFTT
tara:strand:+ start:5281 stop:6975 length:1695 start_codon:yes stop_codon:yes gene_type:complete